MMTEKPPAEPSMDDILASIRKIIAADAKEETSSFVSFNETTDVLDLTDAIPEELEKTRAPFRTTDFPLNNLEEWSLPTERTTYLEEKEKTSQDKARKIPPYELTPSPSFEESLVSQTTLSETTEAFHLLNKMAQEKQQSSESRSSESVGGQTLENLTREMLKPLLKEWLDAHLPSLVRSIVTQQVERIVQHTSMSGSELYKE